MMYAIKEHKCIARNSIPDLRASESKTVQNEAETEKQKSIVL